MFPDFILYNVRSDCVHGEKCSLHLPDVCILAISTCMMLVFVDEQGQNVGGHTHYIFAFKSLKNLHTLQEETIHSAVELFTLHNHIKITACHKRS